RVDVSRVSCNIVTGVGFLGAGTIFMRGDRIKGLATSAGIWVMAAIGMAIGCGMYVVALAATLLVFVVQTLFFDRSFSKFASKIPGHLEITMSDDLKSFDKLEQLLESQGIDIISSHIKKTKEDQLNYSFSIGMPQSTSVPEIVEKISQIKGVRTIEF
ncbi:MAG: MgtC/SapB family protein, partial [Bacteroidaceae bacterium]|nr:MgtC/SapB family protein [Bacteroidaceae bacterium]